MVRVRKYEGNVPKSGKTVFTFGGIELSHLSKVTDKSDLLVHTETGAILGAYPIKTKREDIIEVVAKNIDKLKRFIDSPESYELYESSKELPVKEIDSSGSCGGISMDFYSDGTVVKPNDTRKHPTDTQAIINDIAYADDTVVEPSVQEKVEVVTKKSYNLQDKGW